jgi:hypothetical protein
MKQLIVAIASVVPPQRSVASPIGISLSNVPTMRKHFVGSLGEKAFASSSVATAALVTTASNVVKTNRAFLCAISKVPWQGS